MGKKKHAEHVNHERWLVSYADFITLLFAFFVVMFSVSQVDGGKVGRFQESFQQAVSDGLLVGGGVILMPNGYAVPPPPAKKGGDTDGDKEGSGKGPGHIDLESMRSSLIKLSKSDSAMVKVEVVQHRHELVLRMSDNILFDSGNDTLKDSATRLLAIVANEIRELDVEVRIEGHTDDRAVGSGRWRSNWELSAARATAVIEELSGPGALSPERLSAAGYGEFRPLVPNESEAARARNRRVEIVIIPLSVTQDVSRSTANAIGSAAQASGSSAPAEAAATPSATAAAAPSTATPAGTTSAAPAHAPAAAEHAHGEHGG